MRFGYDDDSNVAVRERHEEDDEREVRTDRRSPRLERTICPRCRMLLSVIETRAGKCRSCKIEVEAVHN